MTGINGDNFSERQLVNRVLDGDSAAFAIIIKKTEGLVAQIVCRMIERVEHRKDITQDVYMKAFKNLKGFSFKAKLSTWIGHIAFNTCVNYLEKKKAILAGDLYSEGNEVFDLSAGGETLLTKKDMSEAIAGAIEQLSTLHKTLIVLYHQEDLSYAEIAGITELPEGTVKSYLFRARKALKERILEKYKREDL